MSKQFEFDQTSIPSQFSINLKDNHGMFWMDTRTVDIYRVFFTSIADILKMNQNKTKSRIGFIMKDDKGGFKFGAILNYRKPEEDEEEDSGNWYLEFTLYPEDMNNLDAEYDNHSSDFVVSANEEAFQIASGKFNSIEYMDIVFNNVIDTVVNFLDANATEGEEVEVVLRGVFTASVIIENGIKIMSIVPGETIKQIIKGDSIL